MGGVERLRTTEISPLRLTPGAVQIRKIARDIQHLRDDNQYNQIIVMDTFACGHSPL